MSTALSDLNVLLAQPCPSAVIWATFVVPFVIAYLVHLPNTRVIRIGLYPLAVGCMAWGIATIQSGQEMNLYFAILSTMLVLGSTPHFAFALHPPQYHPLPRAPPFPALRNSTLFKAFALCINGFRLIGIHPFQPLLMADTRSYPQVRAIFYHFGGQIWSYAIHDFSCYLPMRLAPDTFGSTDYVGGDYNQWCRDLAGEYGLPVLLVRVFFTACFAAMPHYGVKGFWHLIGFLGTATGVYLPEEFPQPTHWPILSTSLNDLWGRRWHNMNQLLYKTLASPFKFSRPLYILAVFLASALHHVVLYYPAKGEWVAMPYLSFYALTAMGCLAERAYYRSTGRKVGGLVGWIWTMTFLYIVSQPMVEHEYGSGWVGVVRDKWTKEPTISAASWTVYALGLGPSPRSMAAARMKST